MDLSQDIALPITKPEVWQAINDTQILRTCLKGCQRMSRLGNGDLDAAIMTQIGPIKTLFEGIISFSNIVENEELSFTVSGQEGLGTITGHLKLTSVEGGTLMSCRANIALEGKLAQLGARLINGAIEEYANDFSSALEKHTSDHINKASNDKNHHPRHNDKSEDIPIITINHTDGAADQDTLDRLSRGSGLSEPIWLLGLSTLTITFIYFLYV